MKKKIRVQIPSLIMETLETDSTFFKIAKERLCNEILYKFSLRFRSNYQSDLSFVKNGMEAQISIDGLNSTIKSTVDFIYPTFDDKTKKSLIAYLERVWLVLSPFFIRRFSHDGTNVMKINFMS